MWRMFPRSLWSACKVFKRPERPSVVWATAFNNDISHGGSHALRFVRHRFLKVKCWLWTKLALFPPASKHNWPLNACPLQIFARRRFLLKVALFKHHRVCILVLESIWKIFWIHTLAIGDVFMPMRDKYYEVIQGRKGAIHSSPSGEKGLFKSSLRCFRWFYH